MKIYSIGQNVRGTNFKSVNSNKNRIKKSDFSEISTFNDKTLLVKDKHNLLTINDISDKKVGAKFIVSINDPKYKDLKILVKQNTKISSDDNELKVMFKADDPSFKGRAYGSIRKNDDGTVDDKMKGAYKNFWRQGMYNKISTEYINKELTSQIKDDYNFYIPSDGDGTRYRDITKLQGGVTKPASYIPATLNGQNMTLVQGVLTNFAQTSKLTDGVDFVEVKPAQGSAFAFLEGLASGKIPTDKPLVFSWGDNFSDINITKLILDHEKNHSGLTILSILADKNQIQSLGALKVKSKDNLTVSDFKEKPNREQADSFAIPDMEDYCVGSVGPYVISKEVLQNLKEKYTENPESFLDKEEGKGYDFSKMILAPLVKDLNAGKIKDENGNELKLRAKMLPKNNTWSDLGNEKDFSANMKSIKEGAFSNLPEEMKTSIAANVDDNNNISFNKQTKQLFEDLQAEYGLHFENAICYSKEA